MNSADFKQLGHVWQLGKVLDWPADKSEITMVWRCGLGVIIAKYAIAGFCRMKVTTEFRIQIKHEAILRLS